VTLFKSLLKNIILLFFFTACVKELPYTGCNDFTPVCNAFITPDHGLTVYLSYSADIMGVVVTLEGAKIDVYENGVLKNVDFTEDNGFYRSDFYPSAGNIYSIDVWKDEIKIFSASDTIPEKMIIQNPTWQFPVGMIDEWTTAGLVSFSFEDDPHCKNYYEIMLAYRSHDGLLGYNYIMEINNEFMTLNTDRSWQDIRSALFSDSLINGKSVDMKIRTQGVINSNPIIIFRNVSWSYYQYRKRLPVHQFLQNRERAVDLSFFRGEPIEMYTNIEGGFGVFAAYYQDIRECQNIQ